MLNSEEKLQSFAPTKKKRFVIYLSARKEIPRGKGKCLALNNARFYLWPFFCQIFCHIFSVIDRLNNTSLYSNTHV